VKICDILYLSVCQIPVPIRSFLKLLADSIQRKNPKLPLTDVYRILNELIIERWLSVSFSQPEFFGILPKPLNFSDRFKYIFFNTA
jgi:GTPase-activator protein for Ras-like GTPase